MSEEDFRMVVQAMADGVAAAAADGEEAAQMCRDLQNANDLDAGQLARLMGRVEDAAGWSLPRG